MIADHFSRRVMGIGVFLKEPNAQQTCTLLERAVQRAGRAPKYTVTDQGGQFEDEYRAWCSQHEVKPRFGALYRHGSIALTERVIRTIKDELVARIAVPFGLGAMRTEAGLYVQWYNEFRPHASLGGRTPNEVYESRTPARNLPRFEPRARYPTSAELRGAPGDKLELEIDYLEGRKHLPIVKLRRAA